MPVRCLVLLYARQLAGKHLHAVHAGVPVVPHMLLEEVLGVLPGARPGGSVLSTADRSLPPPGSSGLRKGDQAQPPGRLTEALLCRGGVSVWSAQGSQGGTGVSAVAWLGFKEVLPEKGI